MAEKTAIEWTEATWNPITGCSVVSPGCTNCYAMRLAGTRLAPHPSRAGLTRDSKAGPVWTGEVRLNPQWLDQPLRWRRPRMIFVCAHGDLFHESVPDAWIDKVFAVMALAPQHTFQVLTKRSKRMREYLADPRRPYMIARRCLDLVIADPATHGRLMTSKHWPVASEGDPDDPSDVTLKACPLPNVWLGVSAEDQARADERIPDLLATPAAVRWLSAEPLLGAVEFNDGWIDRGCCQGTSGVACPECPETTGKPYPYVLDWVVVGGESGQGARPMHPDWARSLRDQCAAAGVPFFFKQWGNYLPASQIDANGDICRIGSPNSPPLCMPKKRAGRLLDGVEHNGMPEAVR